MADETFVVEDEDFAILRRIGMPGWDSTDLWIASLGKLRPYAAHGVG